MPAAQQALSLLSRWPSAAAGTSSAVRGAACLLCQPAAHAAVLSHSNQWGCLPAPQLPQHSSAAGVDQHDAWRAAYCHLPQPCAVLPAIERRSTASAAVPLPLQPWAVSVPRRTALQPRARQQARQYWQDAGMQPPRLRSPRLPGVVKEASTQTSPQPKAPPGRTLSDGHDLPRDFHQAGSDKVSIKAQVIFDACWRRCEETYGDRLQSPAEIVWLNGAPGSGKGTNTPFILESRGLSRAVTMSSLLDSSAEIRAIKDRGELVPDTLVGDALLAQIFDPDVNDGLGLVIDGFPRTALQVDFLKLLYDRMLALHLKHADTADEWRFPRPSFKVVVLYVEQEESVRRQMHRAMATNIHNQRAMDAGTPEDVHELRVTDVDEAKARQRYAVFKQHYGTLLRLKQYFPFSLIDAMGTTQDCRRQIHRELRYQSSMDLDAGTYAAIRHLPLARDLVRLSRQQLVHRLDSYMSKRNLPVFQAVIGVLDAEVVPLLRKCSLAGHAEYKTHNEIFARHPVAADMLLDILSDRGFSGAYIVNERIVPARINPDTWKVENEIDLIHKFRITFEKLAVREESSAGGLAEQAIGQTFLPSHLSQAEADRPAVVAAATMAALQQQAAFARDEALSQDADMALRTPGAAQQVLAAVEHATTPLESHPASSGADGAPKKAAAAAESYSMPPHSSSAAA